MKWGHVFENFLIFFLILGFLSCANKEEQAEKHFRQGFSHQDQGNLDQAIEEYRKAVDLNPNHLKAHTNLGAAYMRQEKYDQAIEEFSMVVKLNYYHANAHYNLGVEGSEDDRLRVGREVGRKNGQGVNEFKG